MAFIINAKEKSCGFNALLPAVHKIGHGGGDTVNPIEEYAMAIESEQIIVPDRVKRLYSKLLSIVDRPGKYHFDEARARRPIDFIERFCKHSKGEWAGKPLKLELFQRAYIAALFGFVDDEGLRQYRESLFLVARKNGKSSLLAGICLYCLIADGEPGAEVYSLATKRAQSALIFDECQNMVKQSPDLAAIIHKRKNDLYFAAAFAKMQPLSRNSNSLDGLNSSLVVIDELHAVADRNLYEVMKQSQSARRQPLLIMITTAGTRRECIFDDIYHYARGVVDGQIDDEHFLPVLYELDSKDEWQEPRKWIKANPGIDTIKKREDLQAKILRAAQSPVDLAGVLCKDFNVISTTSTAWLSFDDIDNKATFDIENLRGGYFIGGADLSRTTDLTAAAALMMDANGQKFVAEMFWLPAANFGERVRQEKIPYDKWYEAGLLRLCDGNTINYSDVTAWYLELVQNFDLSPAWIYYDSYSAAYWVKEMQSNGFRMTAARQGYKTLSLPMQMLAADLRAKKINYGDNPLLKWCLTNVALSEDRNGNMMPKKANSPKYRIDGAAALLNCYVGLGEHLQEFSDLCND